MENKELMSVAKNLSMVAAILEDMAVHGVNPEKLDLLARMQIQPTVYALRDLAHKEKTAKVA